MCDKTRIKIFADVFCDEVACKCDRAVLFALAQFALDLGIINDTKIKNTVFADDYKLLGVTPTTVYDMLTAGFYTEDKDKLCALLRELLNEEIKSEYSSDAEAYICNISRLLMISDKFIRYTAVNAVSRLAYDLRIISNRIRMKSLCHASALPQYDYHTSVKTFSKLILEAAPRGGTERQSA